MDRINAFRAAKDIKYAKKTSTPKLDLTRSFRVVPVQAKSLEGKLIKRLQRESEYMKDTDTIFCVTKVEIMFRAFILTSTTKLWRGTNSNEKYD